MVVLDSPSGKMLSAEDAKRSAVGRWSALLTSAGLPSDVQDGQHHPCPKCGGNDRFRVFGDFAETGGAYCNQCFAERNSDGIATLMWLLDCDFQTALNEITHRLGTVRQTSQARPPKAKRGKQSWPTSRDAIAALESSRGSRTAAWNYHDASGQEIGIVLRWDRPDGHKDIIPLKLTAAGWQCGAMPEPRPLYRLPELSQAEVVFVTEGEKAVDAGVSISLNCTTSSGGSNAPQKTDWTPLSGKTVVIVPDNDDAGRKYAETVASILTRLSPPTEVRIVNLSDDWPELPGKGDLVDWLNAHNAVEPECLRERVKTLVNSVAPYGNDDIGKPADVALNDAELPEADDDDPGIVRVVDMQTQYSALKPVLVDSLIRRGEAANIISATKVGKSWLNYDLCLSVATGNAWCGRFETTQGRVLLIDNELHPETLSYRINEVARAMGLTPRDYEKHFDVWPLRGNLCDIFSIRRTIESIPRDDYSLIAVDALYRMIPNGVSENGNSEMTQVFNCIDHYAAMTNAAWVSIHHSTKGDQADKRVTDVGSGAGSISRTADSHIVLREHETQSHFVFDAALRSFPAVEPVTLRWEFPLWRVAEDVEPRLANPNKSRQATKDAEGIAEIREVLAGDANEILWLSERAIRDATRMGRDRNKKLLGYMKKDGRVLSRCGAHQNRTTTEYRLATQT